LAVYDAGAMASNFDEVWSGLERWLAQRRRIRNWTHAKGFMG
jgi:hypothetical protein